jgi:predicted metal-dependent hydrolase
MTANDSIVFDGLTIPYDITYSLRRTSISIIVHRTKRVEIKAPAGTPVTFIQDLAGKKAAWIVKRLRVLDSMNAPQVERKYHDGEVFFFLGTPFSLAVLSGSHDGAVRFDDGYLVVNNPWPLPGPDQINYTKIKILDWYRDQATMIIGDKVLEFAEVLGIDPPPFKLRNVRRRWGSCNHKNNLNFNIRLIMAPIALVEYVVLHELCHIRHKNHAREFWDSLRVVMPDYSARRGLLKQEGYRYVL